MELQTPLPLVKSNQSLEVIYLSEEASKIFPPAKTLQELIDKESDLNRIKQLPNDSSVYRWDISIPVKSGAEILFECFIVKDEMSILTLAFEKKEEKYEDIYSKITELQNLLEESTNELSLKNAKLERAARRSNKRSGPFISLSEGLGYIPLLGDLSEKKLHAIRENIMVRVHADETERILVDLTAVGNIKEDSVSLLIELLSSLQNMGPSIVLVGLHPKHARQLSVYKDQFECEFSHSAKTAIKEWFISKRQR